MKMVDPWGGFYDSQKGLNDTLARIPAQDLAQQQARQQLAMGNIQLQSAQRSQSNLQDAQDAASALQPTSRSLLVDQQGPPQPVDNTAGLSARSALTQQIAQAKNQTYNPALPLGDNDVLPGTTNLTPGATQLQAQQVAPLQTQLDAIPDTAQVAGEPLPQIEQQQQIPVTDADRMGAMIKSYLANGDTAKASELFKMAHEYAQAQGQIAAIGGGSLEDYYTKLTKASLTQTQSDQIEKALTTVAALAKEGPQYLKMAEPSLKMLPGLEGFSADSVSMDPNKRFVSIDAGNGQTIVIDNQNPKDWKLEKKDPISDFSSFHAGGIARGLTEGQISTEWHKQKLAEQAAGRAITSNNMVARETMQGVTTTGLPVYKDSHGGEPFYYKDGVKTNYRGAVIPRAEGMNLDPGSADAVATIQDKKATGAALKKNTERLTTLTTFTNRIDNTLPILESAAKKYGQNLGPMLNSLRSGAIGKIGSPEAVADMKKLDLALIAVRGELGKVETGNIGASGVDVSTANEWRRTLGGNLDSDTILRLTPFIRQLSQTSKDSVSQVNDDLRSKLRGKPNGGGGITTKGGFVVTVRP